MVGSKCPSFWRASGRDPAIVTVAAVASLVFGGRGKKSIAGSDTVSSSNLKVNGIQVPYLTYGLREEIHQDRDHIITVLPELY